MTVFLFLGNKLDFWTEKVVRTSQYLPLVWSCPGEVPVMLSLFSSVMPDFIPLTCLPVLCVDTGENDFIRVWTQDHILFSLFRRCSGEMETSPCQVSVLAGQGVFFAAGIPLFNSNITNFAFCAFKGVEETYGAYRLYGTRWGRRHSAHFPSFRLFVRFTCNSSLQMWRRLPLVL